MPIILRSSQTEATRLPVVARLIRAHISYNRVVEYVVHHYIELIGRVLRSNAQWQPS